MKYPEFHWHKEIKYPVEFSITEKDGKLSGTYKDQNDYVCEFELVAIINSGSEMLLSDCRSTKNINSIAPIQRVKYENGKLRGKVVTTKMLFEWEAINR